MNNNTLHDMKNDDTMREETKDRSRPINMDND